MALPAPTSSCFRLTAFVLKSFAQARSFIFIDPQELAAAKGWIVQQQWADGSFPAVGRILNKDIQVGSLPASSWGLGLALAAPRCCLGPAGAGGCPLWLGMKPTNPLTGWDPRHSPADSLRGGSAPGDGPGLGGKRSGPGRCRLEEQVDSFALQARLAIFWPSSASIYSLLPPFCSLVRLFDAFQWSQNIQLLVA